MLLGNSARITNSKYIFLLYYAYFEKSLFVCHFLFISSQRKKPKTTQIYEENKTMVTVAVIPYRSDCFTVLHTILHFFFRTDAITHQRSRKGGAMDNTLRNGKDLSVRRLDNTWSRGI